MSQTPKTLRAERIKKMSEAAAGLTVSEAQEEIERQLDCLPDSEPFADVVVACTCLSTKRAVRAFARTATAAQLSELRHKLAIEEGKVLQREARDDEWDRQDAARNQPMTEQELAEIDESNARAKEAAETFNSTEARFSRIEALLERVATALEKK
jgi:hypothetical protein